MAKKIKLLIAAFLAVFTLCGVSFAFTNNTYADEKGTGAVLIQVSPVKQKISLAPGSSYSGTFKIHNAGTQEFTYTAYATPYSVINDNYDPNYTNVTSYSQISEWITFDKSTEKGTLQPGEVVEVKYTVNVPEDVPAGGQYAVLMAQTDAGNAENATIAAIHRVGCILYAAVPGETRTGGEIVKNTVNTFYFDPPLTVSSLVKNTGNVEQTAKYTVKIYPLFSDESVFNTENAEEGSYDRDVMPETSRFNSITWEGAPSIGIFRVTQIIDFGGQQENREVTKLVLICPLWLLFVIFAIIFFIIFWLVSRARDRKRGGKKGKKSSKATPAKTENKSETKSDTKPEAKDDKKEKE